MEHDEEKESMRELLTRAALDLLSSEALIARLEEVLKIRLDPRPHKKRRTPPRYGPNR